MQAAIAEQLEKAGFVTHAVDLIPQQLSNQPNNIIKAAQAGYLCGCAFRNTKTKESPYSDHDSKEYKFWNMAFDFGIKDSKKQ